MPQVPPSLVRARAARLREAGAKALSRRLESRLGTATRVLVEAPGRGRGEDYAEIVLSGAPATGSVIEGVLMRHDGRKAWLAD
jgi:threonylcarbamoyladenosine tRNA methylthiotransferase MtaB